MASTTADRLLDAAHALVLERGFNATTVDAVLSATGVSKGAFFHHFSSKVALGRALVERYARHDAEILASTMAAAEAETDDPAEQLVAFVRLFEEAASEPVMEIPGCLFVPFIYEQVPGDIGEVIEHSIALWRSALLEKLELAAARRPLALDVDLSSLADQVFTNFEGGFVLARATGDQGALAAQLAHLRAYLSLLFFHPAQGS